MTAPAIERTLDLAAPPDRVWHALTDPAELATWFAAEAESDLRAGGEGWLGWTEHGRFHVQVEVVDAPVRFAFRWAREPDSRVEDGAWTLVEFDLAPRPGGGTTLRLRESGFADDAARRDNVDGWFGGFGELAAHLADTDWEAGIRRTYSLRSPRDRVWAAFADPAQLAAWWSGNAGLDVRTGADGWFTWEGMGRFGMRFEAVEPPDYLCWTWVTVADVPVAEAQPRDVLRTEWRLATREDGGTDLSLLETGFEGPEGYRMNDGGWDGDVMPALRRLLDEG